MVKRNAHDLVAAVSVVKGLIETIPPRSSSSVDHQEALDHVHKILRSKGARFGFEGGGDLFVFAGVRATATAGREAALAAWVRAANRKLDRQAIARMSQ